MTRILFSPIGDTDPVRDCYDGACLHIVRHYHPDKVVLFLTAEMSRREAANQRYSRAVKYVAPECQVELIRTDIEDAHLYDSYIEIVPRLVHRYMGDDVELLLNLSSGTPQIKTIMAVLSVENGLRGIQVYSPNKGSNSRTGHMQAEDDIESILENNFDNDPESENRCQEPPLQVIRYFSERQRILSLIHLYEYTGAWELAKGSINISKEVKDILQHAMLRQKLQKESARKVLSTIDGIKLFPDLTGIKNKRIQDEVGSLFEYLLSLIITQRKGYIAELMVKASSYMFELLRYYVLNHCPKLNLASCLDRKRLRRSLLEANNPGLLNWLDLQMGMQVGKKYQSNDLSFMTLCHICRYAEKEGLGESQDQLSAIIAILEKIDSNDSFRKLRNSSAHTIEDSTEESFRNKLGMSSGELVGQIVNLSAYILPFDVKKYSGMYNILNKAVETRLLEK